MGLGLDYVFFVASNVAPRWHETWPFGPGLEEGLLSVVLKGLFILAILGGMAWLLRYLFGPGGPLRDKEFDEPDPEDPARRGAPDDREGDGRREP